MLYILFGKDKIGKKTVRDRLAQRFGLTIIPKYTCDINSPWTLKYKKSGVWESTSEDIIFDSEDTEDIKQKIYAKKSEYGNVKSYLHRRDDPFLKFFVGEPHSGDFLYDIKKNIDGKTKDIKYLIRCSHIKKALETVDENFILVCASGDVIEKIFALQQKMQNSQPNIAKIQLVFIDGSRREAGQNNSTWHSSPAEYYFKNSYRFIKLTNKTCLVDNETNQQFDRDKFNEMIDKQWVYKTHMLPTCISCFVVRPFSDHQNKVFNVNDICYEAIKQKILEIKDNIVRNGRQTRDLTFETLAENGKNIFSQISNVISKSQLVIIDLREHRQNCYYEYGYAQALVDILSQDWGHGSGKFAIGLIGAIEDTRGKEVCKASNEEISNDLDLQVKNVWMDITEGEKGKAFDTTQFAHYKYIVKIADDYDGYSPISQADFIKPDGQEPTFEDKIKEILTYKFKGVNALVDEE